MKFFFFSNRIFLVLLMTGSMMFGSCLQKPEPPQKNIIKTVYPKLSDAIIERDFDELWKYKDHQDENVKAIAWKAIGISETDNLSAFIDYAVQEDDSLAWFALSLHPLTTEQVAMLGEYFAEGRIQSESVCNVFFQKGTLSTLDLLLKNPELLAESKICAKAVGGMVSRIQVDDFTRRTIFDIAFNAGDEIIWRNLLYGFYRSALNRPEAGTILNENISTYLDARGDEFSILMDEFIVRIAGKVAFLNVMDRRSDRELYQHVQLSNELARNVILFENDELDHPYIKRLLSHSVDNVVILTLQSLQEFEAIPEELLHFIEFEIAPITRDAEVFAEALTVLVENDRDITEYKPKLEFMDSQNEYIKHHILPLFEEIESEEEYFQRLKKEIGEGSIGGLRAVQAVMNYYTSNFEEKPDLIDRVRELARFALEEGDRSVISTLNIFLRGPKIFPEEEYDWMYNLYENFVKTSQWEKAQVLDEVLKNRFPDRFESLEIPEKNFRIPDWDRLYEMGTHPFWVLETEKGTIEIQLDPIAAPFTVSSVDSLTRAGAYNDVPFHRVVGNFVIQGGDIDRKDGFGGPDYTLPTEPSFQSFERGKLGIASSGQDTEGSQYFVMLNWSPHLDGGYTIFGEVTKGMDVADRIQVGDRVLHARIN